MAIFSYVTFTFDEKYLLASTCTEDDPSIVFYNQYFYYYNS